MLIFCPKPKNVIYIRILEPRSDLGIILHQILHHKVVDYLMNSNYFVRSSSFILYKITLIYFASDIRSYVRFDDDLTKTLR